MLEAVYNAAIPDFNRLTVNRAFRSVFVLFFHVSFAMLALHASSLASDWSSTEQQLARKIVAVTGPGAVAITFENRSSLSRRENEIIQNGLRSALESAGLRFVKSEQSAATVAVYLSENESSYIWVAEIRQGASESSVVMVATPRPEGSSVARDSVPLTLRRTSIFSQRAPILDVAVLEDGASPNSIAVLDPDSVSIYRMQGGRWQQEQSLAIAHTRPWPRDVRGRLIPAKDHLLDAYLPGVICRSNSGSSLSLTCRDSDDPWPLISGTLNGGELSAFPSAGLSNGATTVVPQIRAFFAPARYFFTGALTPAVGKFGTVPKFYSAALLPRDKYVLWLFAAADGQVHIVDGVSDQSARLGWGSDLTSLRTACGAGWQVLSTNIGGQRGDSIRAYEFPDRDPVAVSVAMDLPGPVTALWTEQRGDSAIAVVRNRETGSYEAFRVAVACSQ